MSLLAHATRTTALLLTLPGCASVTQQEPLESVDIADFITLSLPRSEELNESLTATQILAATYDEETYQMQVELEWRPGSIALVGMNLFGTVLFSLEYDGRMLESRGSRALTERIRPEYVLADILVTFWDTERLRSNLQGGELEHSNEDGNRVVTRNGTAVIVIDYSTPDPWSGSVRFRHLERGYELGIRTVAVEAS